MRGMKSLLFCVVIVGGVASFAAPAPADGKSGLVRVWVAQSSTNNTPTDPILLTGAIGDYGTSTSQDKNGKADANGSYEGVDLQRGTFVVDNTKFNSKVGNSKPTMNTSTCSYSLTASGPISIVPGSGTGAYKGLTGKLVITINFAGYGPIKSGKCAMTQNSEPTSSYSAITGIGRLSYG